MRAMVCHSMVWDTCVPSHPINRWPIDFSSRFLAAFPSKKKGFSYACPFGLISGKQK